MLSTIGRRLLAGYVAVAVLLGAAWLVTSVSSRTVQDNYTRSVDTFDALSSDILAYSARVNDAGTALRSYMSTHQQRFLDAYSAATTTEPPVRKQSLDLASRAPDIRALERTMFAQADTWMQWADSVVLSMRARPIDAQALLVQQGTGEALFGRFRSSTRAVLYALDADRQAAYGQSLTLINRLNVALAAIFAGALLVLALIGWRTIHAVTRPLERLRQAAAAVGGGNLDSPIVASGTVEFAQLARSMEGMRTQLQASFKELESYSDSISHDLRLSEERYRATFEQAAVGISHVSLDGYWLRANRTFSEITGYTREELYQRRFQDITHPDDLETDLDLARRVAAGEIDTYTMEKRYLRKSGEIVWVNLSVSGMRSPSGETQYYIAVVEDITQRRHLEQRTHDALNTLLAMAEALVERPLGGSQGSVLGADVVGRRLAELTRSVLACRHVAILTVEPETELLHPVAAAGFDLGLEPAWWQQWEIPTRLSDRMGVELSARLRADEVLRVDLSQPPFDRWEHFGRRSVLMAPLRVGDRLVGLLNIHHGEVAHQYADDEIALARAVGRLAALVIERERLMREREEARAGELALREANRRMDEFLSIASHELRTPLTTILGAVQLARRRMAISSGDNGVAATTDRLLERTEYQAHRLNRLVRDLLDVSRIQTDHLDMVMEPCDLVAVVRAAIDEQRHTAPSRNIVVEAPEGPLTVVADADRVVQVVTNYLTNALKYSFEDRPVTVSVSSDGAFARVGVRDEGPGLAPEQHEAIWERFQRAGTLAVRTGSGDSGGGLGLGLYISRTLIERQGGYVGVESVPGDGATFWFTVPLAAHATRDSTTPVQPAPEAAS